jgi:uncharacterized protein involved in exopolysaccharide biosynthesis
MDFDELNIGAYLGIIKKRKLMIGACVIMATTVLVSYGLSQTPGYYAEILLQMEGPTFRSPVTGVGVDMDSISWMARAKTLPTQIKLITSFPVMERVLKKVPPERWNRVVVPDNIVARTVRYVIRVPGRVTQSLEKWGRKGLQREPEEKKAAQQAPGWWSDPTQRLYSDTMSLSNRISVETDEDTLLLKVGAFDWDPVVARDLANAVADAAIDYDVEVRESEARKSLTWMSEQLNELRENVVESEKKFAEFKKEERIYSMEDMQTRETRNIASFSASYLEGERQRLQIEARMKELRKLKDLSKSDQRLNPDFIDDSLLGALYGDIVRTEIQLTSLKEVYRERHPVVVDAKSRLELTKMKFDEELGKAIQNLEAQRSVLLEQGRSLQDTLRRYESDAIETTEREPEYDVIRREVETNKQLYNLLVEKFKETDIIQGLRRPRYRIIRPAITPRAPSGRSLSYYVMVGVLVGSAVGVGLAAVLEFMDRAFKTKDEVSRYLDIPILALIPQVNGQGDGIDRGKWPTFRDRLNVQRLMERVQTLLW